MCEYLPPEIITLILKRLPVEPVVKCTSVCKTWYALIKDPSFISTHLQVASLCDDLLLFQVVRKRKEAYHLRRDNDTFEEYKQFRFPFKHEYGSFRIVGTCNGLVCLAKLYSVYSNVYWNVILWNPSIQKHFILPKPDLHSKRGFSSTLGFGFDSSSIDYKVLLIVSNGGDEDLNEVWLFSLNRLSWMSLSEVCPKHICCGRSHSAAAFVKGALHWPGCSYNTKNHFLSHMILTFDISTEKFYVMNYPETLVLSQTEVTLIKYGESIAVIASVFNDSYHKQHELWVLKEFCVSSSWTKVLHWIDKNEEYSFDSDFIDVFVVRKNGKVLLKVQKLHMRKSLYEFELATLDLNGYHQQEQELMPVVGIKVECNDSIVVGFVESLVLLDKGEEDPEGQNGFQL